MRKLLPVIFTPLFILVLLSFIGTKTVNVFAEPSDHVVISEVQISGDTDEFASTDEFVEIYNPTTSVVSVEGWGLYKKTKALDSEELLVATLSGEILPHGFYLLAHENYNGTTTADITYSNQNFADDNSIILKDATGNVIDLLGLGDAALHETQTATAPVANRSLERKAQSTSTPESMTTGGSDELLGNSEDTDDNLNDFVRHLAPAVSNPQNSTSPAEALNDTTPTDPPTETPTDTPTQTPTPTEKPTETPTPTVTPKPSKVRIIGFFPLSKTVCYIDYAKGFFIFPKIFCVKI